MKAPNFTPSYHLEKWREPRENVTIHNPFESIEEGNVTIVPPSGPDLHGYLVDAPGYIKKYKDGHLEFTTTMVIENIGTEAVTNDFKIEGGFGDQKPTSPSPTISPPVGKSPTT